MCEYLTVVMDYNVLMNHASNSLVTIAAEVNILKIWVHYEPEKALYDA